MVIFIKVNIKDLKKIITINKKEHSKATHL